MRYETTDNLFSHLENTLVYVLRSLSGNGVHNTYIFKTSHEAIKYWYNELQHSHRYKMHYEPVELSKVLERARDEKERTGIIRQINTTFIFKKEN